MQIFLDIRHVNSALTFILSIKTIHFLHYFFSNSQSNPTYFKSSHETAKIACIIASTNLLN